MQGNERVDMDDRVLTLKEAAEYLRISRPTMYKMIKGKKIRAKKLGNGYRILLSEIRKYLLEAQTF